MNLETLSVKVFKALGHPLRYKIIKYLMDGPRCVCELNEVVEFSQSNLSQHLRILKDSGLVESNKVGMKIIYELADEKIKELVEMCDVYVDSYLKTLRTDA